MEATHIKNPLPQKVRKGLNPIVAMGLTLRKLRSSTRTFKSVFFTFLEAWCLPDCIDVHKTMILQYL